MSGRAATGLSVSFYTFGCKLNYSEESTYARQFTSRGVRVVRLEEGADIVVLNSCAVTEQAQHKCRQLLHRVRREHAGAFLVLVGCYAELSPGELYSHGADFVVMRHDKHRLAEAVLWAMGYGDEIPCGGEAESDFFPAYSLGDRTRAFLKVQDGCSYGCSYCTIPLARGRGQSVRIAEAVQQAGVIAKMGTREIVISGINTGDFGRGTSESFLDLLMALQGVEGILRYRISSIEPNLLTDAILDFVASSGKFLPHLHVPLQSGSDNILRAMKRRYTTEVYWQRVVEARRRMPDLFLGVDVIVGFPGETEMEFEKTYDFLLELKPSYLHVFPYSSRPGTLAARMPGKVPSELKRVYARRLAALSEELHTAYCERFAGAVRPVLVEHVGRNGMGQGLTDNYIRAEFPIADGNRGRIAQVRLGGHLRNGIMKGEVVDPC